MKLVKTICLNYGNHALEAWENACKEIKKKNQELLESAPVVEIEGWETRELIAVYEEIDNKWVNSGKKRLSDTINMITTHKEAWVLGLNLCDLPQEGEAVVSNFLVKKAVFKKQQEVELLTLPEKPSCALLTSDNACEEMKKVNNLLSIPSYYLRDWGRIEGGFEWNWVFDTKVLKFEFFDRDLGEDGYITVHRRWFRKETYRVFPDRLEVWEEEIFKDRFPYDRGVGDIRDAGVGSWSDKGYF